MKYITTIGILLIVVSVKAQTCACEKEFLHIKNLVENNFAGFPGRVKTLSKAVYKKQAAQLLKLARNKFSSDNCPLIIYRYLDMFKSHHLGFSFDLDYTKIDTGFIDHRPRYNISDKQLAKLKVSRSWEGIYYFIHDSSTKIAVIKDPTPLHDYIGVVLESTRPTWKKGMIKWEGKLVNDSLLEGLLYMRNHRPKLEYFPRRLDNTMIGGDWRREGAPAIKNTGSYTVGQSSPPIAAKSLSASTFYIKMASCHPRYKPIIDSILQANEQLLNNIPNLVLDLRGNGGGGDDAWEPLIPYFYTQPIQMIGADILATPQNIDGYKQYLTFPNLSPKEKDNLQQKIDKMEQAKGQWVNIYPDETIASFQPKPFPKKIAILIDRWCGSAGEELLLAARQSTKVILVGENTIGNLDYSNVVNAPFSCYPYTLVSATTRSRRLDKGQGIDNIGVAPNYHLPVETDWINETLKILEQP